MRFFMYFFIFSLSCYAIMSNNVASASSKRHLKGKLCSAMHGDWNILLNRIIYDRIEPYTLKPMLKDRPEYSRQNYHHHCDDKDHLPAFLGTEFTTYQMSNPTVMIEGDFCAANVKLRYVGHFNAFRNNGKRKLSADFFKNMDSAFTSSMTDYRHLNPIEREVATYLAIRRAQCKMQIRTIDIRAWKPSHRFGKSKRNIRHGDGTIHIYAAPFKPTFLEFYRGTLAFDNNGIALSHAEPNLSNEIAVAQKKKWRPRYRYNPQKAQEGFGLLVLGLLAAYASSPCNDPDISDAERDRLGCR